MFFLDLGVSGLSVFWGFGVLGFSVGFGGLRVKGLVFFWGFGGLGFSVFFGGFGGFRV